MDPALHTRVHAWATCGPHGTHMQCSHMYTLPEPLQGDSSFIYGRGDTDTTMDPNILGRILIPPPGGHLLSGQSFSTHHSSLEGGIDGHVGGSCLENKGVVGVTGEGVVDIVDMVDVRVGERCICRRPAAPSPKVHPSHQGTVLSSSATARPALKQTKRVGSFVLFPSYRAHSLVCQSLTSCHIPAHSAPQPTILTGCLCSCMCPHCEHM